jgi:hypothetical protein
MSRQGSGVGRKGRRDVKCFALSYQNLTSSPLEKEEHKHQELLAACSNLHIFKAIQDESLRQAAGRCLLSRCEGWVVRN